MLLLQSTAENDSDHGLKTETKQYNGNDSSYDSDVSETLEPRIETKHEDDSSDQQQSDDYKSHLEFGLKLGYSKSLINLAVRKLGTKCEQNELLGELIKLATTTATRKTVRSSSNDSDDNNDNVPVTNLHLKLRPIVIDGSNVAMSHGNKEVFSCRGLKICVDWFRQRGHREITVFVPKWRRELPRFDNQICDREILHELEQNRFLVFTPSRHVNGKRLVCYDDRYVLRLAADTNGIVVSNDNYRDLAAESAEFREVIEKRILMYSFVNDKFMPPEDPLGRTGPSLAIFLSFAPANFGSGPCPYGKKCTYGQKCKFSHLKTLSLPLSGCEKKPLCVSKSQPEPFLHKRLQRQLTLNPGNDPRLQNLYGHKQQPQQSSFNLWPPQSEQQNQTFKSQQQFPTQYQPMFRSHQQLDQSDAFNDARYKLKFHLNALFPTDQVQHVMNLYPNELSAQKLCAAILTLFPPNN